MIALQQPQLLGAKRLAAEAQPRDAKLGQRLDHRLVDIGRIGLDRPFIAGRPADASCNTMAANCRNCSGERCVGVPPPKYSVSTSRGVRAAASLQLNRPQIVADQIIAPGDEREVAVAAAMPAERHVNVRGPRRSCVMSASARDFCDRRDRSGHDVDSTDCNPICYESQALSAAMTRVAPERTSSMHDAHEFLADAGHRAVRRGRDDGPLSAAAAAGRAGLSAGRHGRRAVRSDSARGRERHRSDAGRARRHSADVLAGHRVQPVEAASRRADGRLRRRSCSAA